MYGWMDMLTSKYVGGSFVIQSIETVITLTNKFRVKSGEDRHLQHAVGLRQERGMVK